MSKYDKKFKFKTDKPLKKTHIKLFQDLMDSPDAASQADKRLLVVCTPRCGSTLFTDALSNTGKIGLCEEWFNYEYFAAYSKVIGGVSSLREYFNKVAMKTVKNTGVFSLKLHVGQIVAAKKDFDLDLYSFGFNHIVYLYRRDKVAQAVSLAKAIKSDKFRHNEEATGKDKISYHDVSYTLGIIIEQDKHFHDNLYADVSYAYEDFVALDPPHYSYNEILKAFGKEPQDKFSTSMKKQADKYSEEMTRKFKSYILGEINESC